MSESIPNNKKMIIKDRYLPKDWNSIILAFENTKNQKVTVPHPQRVVET